MVRHHNDRNPLYIPQKTYHLQSSSHFVIVIPPSSHFRQVNWAKDTGVLIKCIATFSATFTTDLHHTDSQKAHEFKMLRQYAQKQVAGCWVQSFSDLASLVPVRVSKKAETDRIRGLLWKTPPIPVFVFDNFPHFSSSRFKRQITIGSMPHILQTHTDYEDMSALQCVRVCVSGFLFFECESLVSVF